MPPSSAMAKSDRKPAYRIGTADSPKNEYFTIAEALAFEINTDPNMRFRLAPTLTHASNDNLFRVSLAGDLELALVMGTSVTDAVHGMGFWREFDTLRTLRIIAPLGPEYIFIVAARKAGIRTARDLAGKRIAIGPPGAGLHGFSKGLKTLPGFDWARDAVYVESSFADLSRRLKQGRIDAFVYSLSSLDTLLKGIFAGETEVHFVPFVESDIETIRHRFPHLRSAALPDRFFPSDRFYPSGKPEPLLTLVDITYLVGSSRLSDETAGALARTLFEKRDLLRSHNPMFLQFGHEDLGERLGSIKDQLHPGARKAFEDLGLLRSEQGLAKFEMLRIGVPDMTQSAVDRQWIRDFNAQNYKTGLRCVLTPSGPSMDSIRSVLSGSHDIALARADILADLFNGKTPLFSGAEARPIQVLRAVGNFLPPNASAPAPETRAQGQEPTKAADPERLIIFTRRDYPARYLKPLVEAWRAANPFSYEALPIPLHAAINTRPGKGEHEPERGAPAESLRLAGGSFHGVLNEVSSALSYLVTKYTDMEILALPTSGVIESLDGLAQGKWDLALAPDTVLYEAMNGLGHWKDGPLAGVDSICTVYESGLSILAAKKAAKSENDIRDINDLITLRASMPSLSSFEPRRNILNVFLADQLRRAANARFLIQPEEIIEPVVLRLFAEQDIDAILFCSDRSEEILFPLRWEGRAFQMLSAIDVLKDAPALPFYSPRQSTQYEGILAGSAHRVTNIAIPVSLVAKTRQRGEDNGLTDTVLLRIFQAIQSHASQLPALYPVLEGAPQTLSSYGFVGRRTPPETAPQNKSAGASARAPSLSVAVDRSALSSSRTQVANITDFLNAEARMEGSGAQVFPFGASRDHLLALYDGAFTFATVCIPVIKGISDTTTPAVRDDIRIVCVLNEVYLWVMAAVDKNIEEWSDIANRAINIGAPGSAEEQVATDVLKAIDPGWEKSIHVSEFDPEESIDAFLRGEIDVLFLLGSKDFERLFVELTVDTRPAHLLSIPPDAVHKLAQQVPIYRPSSLPSEDIQSMAPGQTWSTVAFWEVLACAKDTDNETVNLVASKALELYPEIAEPSRSVLNIEPGDPRVPFLPPPHPEAVRVFNEAKSQ